MHAHFIFIYTTLLSFYCAFRIYLWLISATLSMYFRSRFLASLAIFLSISRSTRKQEFQSICSQSIALCTSHSPVLDEGIQASTSPSKMFIFPEILYLYGLVLCTLCSCAIVVYATILYILFMSSQQVQAISRVRRSFAVTMVAYWLIIFFVGKTRLHQRGASHAKTTCDAERYLHTHVPTTYCHSP